MLREHRAGRSHGSTNPRGITATATSLLLTQDHVQVSQRKTSWSVYRHHLWLHPLLQSLC